MKQVFRIRKIITSAFFIIILVAPIVTLIAFEISFRGKIYPGVTIGGINVARMTFQQAKDILEKKLNQERQEISLQKNGQVWLLKMETIDFHYLTEEMANQAYGVGRKGNLVRRLFSKLTAIRQNTRLNLVWRCDEEKLNTTLASISAQLNRPTVPASVYLADGKVEVERGLLGEEVDLVSLKNALASRWDAVVWSPVVEVPFAPGSPLPDEAQVKNTIERAETIKERTVVLNSRQQNFVIEGSQLVNFLAFNGGWERDKIGDWVNLTAGAVRQPAKNALFEYKDGKVVQFSASQPGYQINPDLVTNLIWRELIAFEEKDQPVLTLDLPLEEIAPQIATADSNQFGITGLVGKGESWFFHSIASRVHNVELATSKFNGVLIRPDEEFSFNQILGEVSKNTGYQQAYIIQNGRTVLGDGGGVCQVSTTLFRAALYAGLPVTERWAHAYRVSYYEYNSILGMDATVYSPSADLKFKNNYPCHLLIQTEIDKKANYLAFLIYGCPDSREVTIDQTKTWDQAPPPPPLYTDDLTLPAGTIKQVDFAAWGAKASFHWLVTRREETLSEETFYSNYRPWQAIYLRGTKNP